MKNNWVPFFFDSNQFSHRIDSMDGWNRLRAAYPNYSDQQLLDAKEKTYRGSLSKEVRDRDVGPYGVFNGDEFKVVRGAKKTSFDRIIIDAHDGFSEVCNRYAINSGGFGQNNPPSSWDLSQAGGVHRSDVGVTMDYGYCVTAHKAQGSQWPHVFIYLNDRDRRMRDYDRWLYTAITRAEERVVLNYNVAGDFS